MLVFTSCELEGSFESRLDLVRQVTALFRPFLFCNLPVCFGQSCYHVEFKRAASSFTDDYTNIPLES